MAKQRSPRYPSLSLAEAIDKARRIYSVEHTHAAPREVVIRHVGYTTLNGASLTLLGTLLRYGLLEADDDKVRISDDAVTVIEHGGDDGIRAEALKRLAFEPELFKELYQQFGDHLPSEANLRHWLIKRGFLPKAADEVIRVYRENMELVAAEGEGYDDEEETPSMASQPAAAIAAQRNPPKQPAISELATDVRQDVFSLAEGPVTIQWPASISADSFQDVGDWLDIVKRKIGRSVQTKPGRVGFGPDDLADGDYASPVVQAPNPPNVCVQQEVGEPAGSAGPALRVL
jgi:hypothetical protein